MCAVYMDGESAFSAFRKWTGLSCEPNTYYLHFDGFYIVDIASFDDGEALRMLWTVFVYVLISRLCRYIVFT